MFRSEATNFLFALDFDTGMYYNKQVRVRREQKWNNGVWLSLVERLVRDQEAVGSNPATPTSGEMPQADRARL